MHDFCRILLRVQSFGIRFEKVVLGDLCKVRAVARWNEVAGPLLRSISALQIDSRLVHCRRVRRQPQSEKSFGGQPTANML